MNILRFESEDLYVKEMEIKDFVESRGYLEETCGLGSEVSINIYTDRPRRKVIRLDFENECLINEWSLEGIWFADGRDYLELVSNILAILECAYDSRKTIDELGLSTKAYNLCMRHCGKRKSDGSYKCYIVDLIHYSEKEISQWKTMGFKTLQEIKDKLAKRGLSLNE